METQAHSLRGTIEVRGKDRQLLAQRALDTYGFRAPLDAESAADFLEALAAHVFTADPAEASQIRSKGVVRWRGEIATSLA